MRISKKRMRRVLRDVVVNLASGWLGILLISPGITGTGFSAEYLSSLPQNLISGMVGILIAYWISEED